MLFIMLLVMGVPVKAGAVPQFTRGTMTSHTETTTRVTESYNIVEYSTGNSYTMTGTNISIPGAPGLGVNYTQTIPGEPTQFSESSLTPGVSRVTQFTRETEIFSVTDSVSVFTM